MRDLFPGFYKRTEEELSKLWQEGIFVFDTNMLLNVYRYTQRTRGRYFEILGLLKKRNQLWIPYQVAYEYQNNRIEVIQGQLDAYTDVSNMLQTTLQKLESSLEPYKRKHGFIDVDKLANELANAIKEAKTTVTQDKERDKSEYEALKRHDRLLEKLEEYFQGSIGNPYDRGQQEELYRQAQLRVELRIPPGWEDEGKGSLNAFGDIVLWFQLIDYARMQKKPIVFVTDDGKKDWWIRDTKGKPIKPLPALVQEMFVEAGVLLHMYQGYEFLEQAEHFLKLEEEPDIIADAMAVTEQNTIEVYQMKQGETVGRLRDYYAAENAVLEWLRTGYPQSEILTNRRGIDFVVVEPDGTRIGVEVKHFLNLFVISHLLSAVGSVIIRHREEPLDKIVIAIVTKDKVSADHAAQRLQRMIDIPSGVSLVLGYLEDDGRFSVSSTLP